MNNRSAGKFMNVAFKHKHYCVYMDPQLGYGGDLGMHYEYVRVRNAFSVNTRLLDPIESSIVAAKYQYRFFL